ncbi:MAG: PEP-CTERM sorting domain-containing protein [Acidobacteriales bacterium]|nr:PEP-CTERM sorting domain-containing protein [Terriglobales bacterium]
MKLIRIATSFLALAGAAIAGPINIPGTVNLNPNLSSPTYVFYSFTDTSGTYQANIPVGPYPSSITVNGTVYSGALTCYDINNPTYVGANYTGQFVPATTFADKEASWLIDQVNSYVFSLNGGSIDPNVVGPYDLAIWQIEFPSSNNWDGGPTLYDPAAVPLISQADYAVRHGYVPDIPVFMPNDVSGQRFGVNYVTGYTFPNGFAGVAQTPEPGTMVLSVTGLIGVLGAARRKINL